MNKLLMVCMGNICRSPMAQVVTSQLAARAGLAREYLVDSAGTHAGRNGEPPDPRAIAALSNRGYAPGRIRSRLVTEKDFDRFDLLLAMDHANMNALRRLCPAEHTHKLRLFLEFTPDADLLEVPDPYFGSPQGFERVLDLCEAGARGLINHLRNTPR